MSAGDTFLVAEAQLALDQARKEKAERIKTLGDPIELPGKALAIQLYNGTAWIGENTTVIRKLDLGSGKTLGLLRGHAGPVTSIAFYNTGQSSGENTVLISGSWDKSIKLWNLQTNEPISTTPDAHSDFVKSLHVFPTLRLLVSGSSDTIVRFWDLSEPFSPERLKSFGSLSSHVRPVECLDGQALSADSAILYTGDTMGVVKVWILHRDISNRLHPRWTATLKDTLNHHRTRVNELRYGNGQLWTVLASADESVWVSTDRTFEATEQGKVPGPIKHPVSVRAILPLSLTDLSESYLLTAAGDVLRTYDVSSLAEPELMSEVDGHWHDITAIRLWLRKLESQADKLTRIEPWIVTTSLDRTIRKWRLADLMTPSPLVAPKEALDSTAPGTLTEDEERELAELMDL